MASGTPYIGSKISLISKAEIRYEGILYDVDSKEATVTLSKVRSYGTENRQAPKQIPPRNEVYEYIIFRGSDIKDLTVSEMGNREEEHPLDPAIVSAQSTAPAPTSRSDPNTTVHSSRSIGGSSILPTPPHPVTPGGGYTQFPPGLGGYNPFGMPYFGRPPMMMGQPLPPHPMHPSLSNQQVRPHPPTPPTHISTISSVNNNSQPSTGTVNRISSQPLVAKSPSETTPPVTTTALHDVSTPVNQGFVPPSISLQTHSKTNSKTRSHVATTDDHRESVGQSTVSTPQITSTQSNSPKDKEDKQSSSSPDEGRRQSKRGGRKDGGQQKQYNNYTPSRGSRGTNNWRGNNWRGGRGEGRYPPHTPRGGTGGGYMTNRPPPNPASQQPLKYTKDFDFESANALFSKDQLEKEMKSKLKLSDDQKEGGSDGAEPLRVEHEELEEGELGGDISRSDDGENEQDEEFYDKTKSFFDTISCESTQANPNRRTNRSQEMALNTETFGVTNRGYSGRSRGYQGRGYNSRYRGGRGYYNQYNGYNQYRGGNGGGYRGGRSNYYGNGGGRGRNYDRDGYSNYEGRGGRNS